MENNAVEPVYIRNVFGVGPALLEMGWFKK